MITWDVSAGQMHTTWTPWYGDTDVCVFASSHVSVVPTASKYPYPCVENFIDEAGIWWMDGKCVVLHTNATGYGHGGPATFDLRLTEDPQGDCTSGWSREVVPPMSYAIV